jgi:hypothetical protein
VAPAERGRRAIERARLYEAEVRILLDPAQQTRLRQIGLQAEGPGAIAEPEVVAQLQLTVEQREQIRTIEEEAIFGWMMGTAAGQAARRPGQTGERTPPRDPDGRAGPLLEGDDGRVGEVTDRPVRLARGQDAALNRLAPDPKANVRVADGLLVRAGKQKIARVRLR